MRNTYGISYIDPQDNFISDIEEINCISDLTDDSAAKLKLLHGDVVVLPRGKLIDLIKKYVQDDLPF